MGDPRDGSREGIGGRDRNPSWTDAAQGLAELLQPRALIEGKRCPDIEIPGYSQRCSGRYCARQKPSSVQHAKKSFLHVPIRAFARNTKTVTTGIAPTECTMDEYTG